MKEKINVFAFRKVFSEYKFLYSLSSFLKMCVGTSCGFEYILYELVASGMNYKVVFPVDSWRK